MQLLGSLTVFYCLAPTVKATNFQDVGKGGAVIRQPQAGGVDWVFVSKIRVTQREPIPSSHLNSE